MSTLEERMDSESDCMMVCRAARGRCAVCAHRRFWYPMTPSGQRWRMAYCGYLAAKGLPQPDEGNFSGSSPCKLFKDRGPEWSVEKARDYADSVDDPPKGVEMLTRLIMVEDRDFIPTGNE